MLLPWSNYIARLNGVFSSIVRRSEVYHLIGEETRLSPKLGHDRRCFIHIHGLLFMIYLALFVAAVLISVRDRLEEGLIYSPARSAVSYETRHYDNTEPSPFKLEPGLEAETAWHEILDHHNIAVQAEDLAKINRTSVKLYNQPGYLSFLDYTHQLHCLNYIRQSAYPEYYKLEDAANRAEHSEIMDKAHCLDTLREILMCHGDVSIHTFEIDTITGKAGFHPQLSRTCRKYEPLDKWNQAHEPIMDRGPILKHPSIGILKPEKLNDTQAG